MRAERLKCNSCEHPIQADSKAPIFSWVIPCREQGAMQSAYQIQVFQDFVNKESVPVWDSGKTIGETCHHVKYEGEELKAGSSYRWKVKYWNQNGVESNWSEESYFETGLMKQDWGAKWIGYDKVTGNSYNPDLPFYCADDFEQGQNTYYLPPVPFLRKEFIVENKPVKAKLYVAAFGLAEVWLNGERVGNDYFNCGLSDYEKTVYSKAYDVTRLTGRENALGIILADGWYAGYMGLNSREWYGDKPRTMVRLDMVYEDGSLVSVKSDSSWKASYGPLLESDIFQGETYDAAKELDGWSSFGYSDECWDNAEQGAVKNLIPEAHIGVPVVEHGRIPAQKVYQKENGRMIVDFGENLVGVLALRMQGDRGGKITIRHAEILDRNNELYLKGNRSARCQDTYILKGEGEEYFQPRFTYHGFRYAELRIEGNVDIKDIRAVKISSEMKDATYFECSCETVNKIVWMIRNTQRSNRFETPTDCCARDERLGWGMEGNHFLAAMTYLGNEELFIRKWTKDIWDGQRENGGLEAIAPPVIMKDIEQFVGDLQSNHGIHMLYTLYRMYGDIEVIQTNYEKMEKYFNFLEQNSDRDIRFATGCDWLGILEKTDHSDLLHGFGDCSPGIIGTSHYAIVVNMMAEMSKAINKTERAEYYSRLYSRIKRAFQLNFIQRDGTLRGGKQGDYLMALASGMFPDRLEALAGEKLSRDLMKDGYIRWKGGTPSTPYFLSTLKKIGKVKLANQFLVSRKYPSIGYMQEHGATTIWERWDAIYENGELHQQVMNAMNHIGFTVTGSYIIAGLAGIDCLEPGFKKIMIHPGITSEITSAVASYQSLYGEIYSKWSWENERFHLECRIPANTTARICIPYDENKEIILLRGIPLQRKDAEGWAELEVEAGTYEMISGLKSLL